YFDKKLDNYAIKYDNEKRPYMDINWKNNIFFDKYFYVHVIDWSSGFTKSTDFTKGDIINDFNQGLQYDIQGGVHINTIGSQILDTEHGNIYNISDEIYNILSSPYKITVNTHNYKTIEEIHKYEISP